MEEKYLVIMEASQKQSYIFGYKRLQNNIIASEVIRYVTNKAFFEKEAGDLFEEKVNLVYDGGGHTILEFGEEDKAKKFVTRISTAVLQKFPQIDFFARVMKYEYGADRTPASNEAKLIRELEEKKARRRTSFRQGKFGIEASIDASGNDKTISEAVLEREEELVREIVEAPTINTKKYCEAYEFKYLGGAKGESNFIAVVHIDGNLMGKRASELPAELDWDAYKKQKRAFSESIDRDFKAAYREMIEDVEKNMPFLCEKLSLGKQGEKTYFPVRRIITAGDDVCFVTEGRIGLECAVSFLRSINRKINDVDKKGYSACAGVAIVHQKYPFYKAYELAEELCGNAKKYIADLAKDRDGAADVCAIDWHIEFGEMSNGLREIRKQYRSRDNVILGCRPYMVCGDPILMERDPVRNYKFLKRLLSRMLRDKEMIAGGKLKNFRTAMKGTKDETEIYIKFNRIDDFLWLVADEFDAWGKPPFYKLYDGKEHIPVYDAIEIMDTYIALLEFDGAEGRK